MLSPTYLVQSLLLALASYTVIITTLLGTVVITYEVTFIVLPHAILLLETLVRTAVFGIWMRWTFVIVREIWRGRLSEEGGSWGRVPE